jgi:hypothetical protein
MSIQKEYLGDAVYIEWQDGMLKLTTENGISATNTIYLEPAVLAAFEDYVRRADLETKQQKDTK